MRAKDALGRHGEELAVRHLCAVGMEILARNWRCTDGEIDVVARDGDTIVFCEVKTRSSTEFGEPVDAVTARKAARLRRLAYRCLTEQRPGIAEVRFDVVSIVRPPTGAAVVEHLRAAF